MDFEVIHQNKRRKILFGGALIVLVLAAVVLGISFASFKDVAKIDLVDGEINYTLADFNVIAIFQETEEDSGNYESVDEVPSSGYHLSDDSNCTVNGDLDSDITITYADGEVNFTGVKKKGTKCYLYFDVGESLCPSGATACETILAGRTVQTRDDFSITVTGTNGVGDIYEAEDDYGTTYYFAGNPTDNWVLFAGFYWRIIRINGDGSIRMIYAGIDSNVTTGTGTQISLDGSNTFRFNNVTSGSQYSYHVGYMYTEDDDASTGQHGNGTSSTIKGIVDSWYSSNLSSYSSYLADSGFCGDREMAEGYTWVDRPSSGYIYFAAWDRRYGTPTFKCNSSEEDNKPDLYTVDNTIGNQALTYPIGLITLDEVRYAGAYGTTSNNDYYLYTNQYYWTMSPSGATSGGIAYVFRVNSTGYLNYSSYVSSTYGVRPVINLKASVTLSGEGTATNPFEVIG